MLLIALSSPLGVCLCCQQGTRLTSTALWLPVDFELLTCVTRYPEIWSWYYSGTQSFEAKATTSGGISGGHSRRRRNLHSWASCRVTITGAQAGGWTMSTATQVTIVTEVDLLLKLEELFTSFEIQIWLASVTVAWGSGNRASREKNATIKDRWSVFWCCMTYGVVCFSGVDQIDCCVDAIDISDTV